MPDAQKTERVQLLMTKAEVKAIDDWSFANRIRGRSEAIRRLVARALEAEADRQQRATTRPRRPK